MSLFSDPTDLNAHGRNLAQLLLLGGFQLEALAADQPEVTFSAWSVAVKKAAAGRGMTLENGQLDWLWEALTTEPKVRSEIGAQIRSREEEWKNQKRVTVLNRDQTLGIFLKPFTAFGGPVLRVPAEAEPAGTIRLLGPLMIARPRVNETKIHV